MNFKSTLLTLMAVFALCLSLQAQYTTKFYLDGLNQPANLRTILRGGADINGDGLNDILVANSSNPAVSPVSPGEVLVYSGSDNSLLHTLTQPFVTHAFGRSVAGLKDVNSDGHDEVIVGAPHYTAGILTDRGRVYVFSGIDGSILFTVEGVFANDRCGETVAALNDVNGDGVADFAAGEPGFSNGPGRIRIFSGVDGTPIRSINQFDAVGFGSVIANAGDVNGDGSDDLIVGDPFFFPPGGTMFPEGRVLVYSGATGALIHTVPGAPAFGATIGSGVAGIGDVDGDGMGEFAATTTGFSPFQRVSVFSGATGLPLWFSVPSQISMILRPDVAGVGDVNGDGVPDVGILTELLGSHFVEFRSGVDGSQLGSVTSELTSLVNTSFDRIGDLDGNGKSDVGLVSYSLVSGDGEMRIYASGVDPHNAYSSNSGTPAAMTLNWEPERGHPNDVFGTLRCSGATPGATGLILVSLAPADIPVFGFDLLVAVDSMNLALTANLGAGLTGEFVAGNISRRNPFLAGSSTYVQFIETGPTLRSSNGVRFTVIP